MAKRTGKKITYNPSLGRVIARAARRSRTGRFHVISSISDEGKWDLVPEGSIRPIKVFTTRNAAVNFAKRSGKGRRDVIIHDTDGRIQKEVSFQTQE